VKQRDALAARLQASSPFKIDILRVSSLGEIQLRTSDPAIVENPSHGGALRPLEIANLRRWVTATAGALQLHGEAHLGETQFVEIVDKQPDRVTTIAATRVLDRVFELTVKTQLVVAKPDPDSAKSLRDRLVNARYTRVVELDSRPCDPSGPVDNCPKDTREKRMEIQLDASHIVTGVGTVELVRGRGAPKEAHAIGCADMVEPKAETPDFRDDYLPGKTSYEPLGGAPVLPIVVDLVTGEDLTAILHTNGWVNCVRGVAQAAGISSTDIDVP
jgi:hypothetical protein